MLDFISSLSKFDFLVIGVVGITIAASIMVYINKEHSKKIEKLD